MCAGNRAAESGCRHQRAGEGAFKSHPRDGGDQCNGGQCEAGHARPIEDQDRGAQEQEEGGLSLSRLQKGLGAVASGRLHTASGLRVGGKSCAAEVGKPQGCRALT